jgi:hypothetical protein
MFETRILPKLNCNGIINDDTITAINNDEQAHIPDYFQEARTKAKV